MEFIAKYAGFLTRTVTVLTAIIVVLVMIVALRGHDRRGVGRHLDMQKFNDFYKDLRGRARHSVLDKASLGALRKEESKAAKQTKKHPEQKSRVHVLDFDGDIKASTTEQLRHEVTAVLSMAGRDDEVMLRLRSDGGMVHGYGLVASQLARIRQAGVPLTVYVDKVAASGDYMMAYIGDRIFPAPFTILDSIGVVAQLPNVRRLSKKHDIDFEVLTAGEYKRTLTVFGENTEKGREKFRENPEVTHELFKNFVAHYRPQLNMDEIATGEIWPGQAALGKLLVDEPKTSNEYLAEQARERDVYQMRLVERKSLQERVGLAASVVVDRVLVTWRGRLNQQKFWQ